MNLLLALRIISFVFNKGDTHGLDMGKTEVYKSLERLEEKVFNS